MTQLEKAREEIRVNTIQAPDCEECNGYGIITLENGQRKVCHACIIPILINRP